MVAKESMETGPLAGVRIIDIATIFAGPFASQILGDYGADVIKVEHPDRGDTLRGHGSDKGGKSLWWKVVGRNKRPLGLDLGSADGAEVLLRLIEGADVVVENFRPGTLERWGLGYEQMAARNPGIILLRVTGFGQTGPYAARPGFGTLAEAMSGFAAMTGEPDGPPTLPPFGLADGIAGITGAMAVMLALYHRDVRGGSGQVIDLAILDPIISVLGPQPTLYDQEGIIPERLGNRSANNAPRNTYKTLDGHWVAVSASATSIAERVMNLIGRPELAKEPWFATGHGRASQADLIDEAVREWIGRHARDEVLRRFEGAEAAIAPVYTVADLVADPHIQERQVLTRVRDPDLGDVLMQNVLARLSATPGRIRFAGRPRGADTDAILSEDARLPKERVEELKALGVVS
jgi:crotonobetainyl-CoA:carnitine CoA-transferase CaiB-like acyl-CoA transferase